MTLPLKQVEKHVKCHKTKRPSFFSGRKLNAYLNANVLKMDEEYRVCSNMSDYVEAHKVKVRLARHQSTIIRTVRLPRLANDKVVRQ